jgi:alpha-glucoside transport system permease protein
VTALEPAVQAPPRNTTERLTRLLSKSPIHIALILIALIWLLPTVGLLITSFRPRSEIQTSGWWTVFSGNLDFTISNYQQVLSNQGMLQAFLNSVSIVVPSTILPLLLSAMAAFALAWVKFRGRDLLFLVVIAMLLIPAQMTFIPLSRLVGSTHTGGTFLPIWHVHTAFALPFGIFLLRNFFITLPKDLIEAARIDGAGNVDIFRRIVVPLSVPALASLGIFQFLWTWNDLLMALVFAPRQGQPMTVQITTLLGTYASEWYILAAASFLVMIVPLAVFFSLQRYFVQGLLAGSVK